MFLADAASAADLDGVSEALAKAYGGRIEPYAAEGFAGFLLTTTEARARLLSRDPRVARVEEQEVSSPHIAPPPAPARPPAAEAATAAPAAVRVAPQWTREGSLWSSGAYAYDGAGNVKSIGDGAGRDEYKYDQAGRLLTATAHTPSYENTQSYTYDRYGNRTAVTTTEDARDPQRADRSVSESFPADPATNRQQGVRYDDAGRQLALETAGLSVTYEWDGADAMKALVDSGVRTVYVYDANDERIAVVTGSSRRYTLRDLQQKVVREYVHEPTAQRWSVERDYVHRGGSLIASFRGGKASAHPHRHYHLDHLGTPRLVTDGAGYKTAIHTYWPFGAEVPSSELDDERLKFTGHERDYNGPSLRDLDYMHARYYAPGVGRFLSVDPVLEMKAALANPQMWNRYTYVRNNPINKVDPTGRYEEDVHHRLTYALSRAAGFSPSEATAIARADQGVDDNPATGPFKSVAVRAAYHFTTPQRRAQMWAAFEKSGSLTALGQYFHAQQDSYSHEGYGPKIGHAAAGHAPDKTHNNVGKAMKMAFNTYSRLNQAADKLGIPRSDRVAWGQIRDAVFAFSRATNDEEKDEAFQRLIRSIAAARRP